MYPECGGPDLVTRRSFLGTALGGATLLAAAGAGMTPAQAQDEAPAPERELPTIQLGDHRVTRLVAGYNPIGGHSHTTLNEARHMREYFTAEQTADFLLHCERQGINTWQYDLTDKCREAIRIARDRGSKMQLICLHADRAQDSNIDEVMEHDPIAIVHHGGVTDGLFRGGKADQVHDFVKRVKDAGALAGVSSHCPDNIRRVYDEGWENDLFMTCFYYVTRPRDEMERDIGKVPVGEPFFESDRDDMTEVVQYVQKPCLGFKILAAGRSCWSPQSVEDSFKYAFSRIKETDAVIVGMFPRFEDEVAENAKYAAQHGSVVA